MLCYAYFNRLMQHPCNDDLDSQTTNLFSSTSHILSDIKVWNLCWPIHLKRSFTILALSFYSHAIRQEETPSDGKCGHSVYLGSQLTSFLGAFNPVELYIHFH